MALESLAPDQRAVIQLVLQQGRSYEALAGLLGISEDAVRQRAQAGLAALGGGTAIDPAEQGLVADYLLGQQDDADREAAQRLLSQSGAANAWASAVAGQLAPVARRGLPDLPGAPGGEPAAAAAPAPEPAAALTPDPDPDPEAVAPIEEAPRSRRERPRRAQKPKQAAAEEPEATPAEPARSRRERPQRPRREAAAPRRPADKEGERPKSDAPPPASRLGGFLLIAALGILVAVLVVYMVGRGDEGADPASQTASPTATATGTPQPLAQLPLRPEEGSDAEGLVQLNAVAQGQVGFTLAARNVEQTSEGEAYAVWLIGEGQPARRLGFAGPIGEDGTLAISGPRQADQGRFVQWLQDYSQMVVSLETTDQTDDPSEVILRASLADLGEGGAAQEGTPTPSATPAP